MEDVVEADGADRGDEGGAAEPTERGRPAVRARFRQEVAGDRGLEIDRHYASLPIRPVGRGEQHDEQHHQGGHAVGAGQGLGADVDLGERLHQADEQAAEERAGHRRHAADDRGGEGGDEHGGGAVAGLEL